MRVFLALLLLATLARAENVEVTIETFPPGAELYLDVSGAKALQLQVDFGANGDLQDYFDWADAALIQ